jgi:hypothetical protein
MPIVVVLSLPYIWDSTLIILVGIAPLLRHDAWTEGRRVPASVKGPKETAVATPV